MKKRIFTAMLCGALALSISSCGSSGDSPSAVDAAKAYAEEHDGFFIRADLVESLEDDGYSSMEAIEAIEDCGIDWSALALEEARRLASSSDMSYDEIVRVLVDEEFTAVEINYAMENCAD